MQTKIQIDIAKDTEKTCRESFRVPDGLSRLHFSVKRPKDFPGTGFLAVYDAMGRLRLQKMIAYGEQELGIGELARDNTAGSVGGKIPGGEWYLLYGNLFTEWNSYGGTFPIFIEIEISDQRSTLTDPMELIWTKDEDDFRINETLFDWNKIYLTGGAWYLGDFHTHTRLSDGKETLKHAMEKAMDMGMDFYVPTEHNLVHTGWTQTSLCVIPGVEITLPLGHFNLFGITERTKFLDRLMLCENETEMKEYTTAIIKEANDKGWLVSINHPFLHIWKWHLDEVELDQIQCLEIVNDPTYQFAKEANDKAISFLDVLWEDGHRITGIGGSDSHNLIDERYPGAEEPSVAGDPGTYVYSKALSPNRILKATGAGNVIVTRHCRLIPKIYGETKAYLPGDKVTEEEIIYECKITDTKEEPVVYLVGNAESGKFVKKSLIVEEREDYFFVKCSLFMNQNRWSWARMEVRDKNGLFMGYVNPIYAGTKKSKYQTFGEMKMLWGLE